MERLGLMQILKQRSTQGKPKSKQRKLRAVEEQGLESRPVLWWCSAGIGADLR